MKKLVAEFSEQTGVPIEIGDIAAKLIEQGYQDEIYFHPVDSNPEVVRGVFYQFRYSPGVYVEPVWVTHISYSANLPVEWQRVICAKELVHIFDHQTAKTNTGVEVSQLLDKLVGPLSTEDYSLADLQAATDRVALYQCLPLLLPRSVLEIGRASMRAGHLDIEEFSAELCMPVALVRLMLSDEWDGVNGELYD